MCGIFGMVRSSKAINPERASSILVHLGHHAMERGKNSSGLAFVFPKSDNSSDEGVSNSMLMKQGDVSLSKVDILKDTVDFDMLWRTYAPRAGVDTSSAVIGHTRWATQGDVKKVENSSPLLVENLIGVHNGDIDITSVPSHDLHKDLMVGQTDTEYLYRALNAVNGNDQAVAEVLAAVTGRVALAWVDRRSPETVFLARAALSPLATAYDEQGNFFWASNPDWFRAVEGDVPGVRFSHVTIVPEGSLIRVDRNSEGDVTMDLVASFIPVARDTDDEIADMVVWRNFYDEDRAFDKASLIHRSIVTLPPVLISDFRDQEWKDENWDELVPDDQYFLDAEYHFGAARAARYDYDEDDYRSTAFYSKMFPPAPAYEDDWKEDEDIFAPHMYSLEDADIALSA